MSSNRYCLVLAWMLLGAIACRSPSPPETAGPAKGAEAEEDFVTSIEHAHSAEIWRQKAAFQSRIVVHFGGNTIFDGRMLMTPSMSRTRLDLASGRAVALWDGEDVFVSPSAADFPEARFNALTWPYFLSVPMKLRDPGARVTSQGAKQLRGESFDAAKLSFDPGVGDTPDDWYVLYRSLESGRLTAMAYIVTFWTSQKEAEKEPHAITYDHYVDVDGIPIPTQWTFWPWSEELGIHGEPLGDVTLQNPEFVAPEPGVFAVPEGARKVALPARPSSQSR